METHGRNLHSSAGATSNRSLEQNWHRVVLLVLVSSAAVCSFVIWSQNILAGIVAMVVVALFLARTEKTFAGRMRDQDLQLRTTEARNRVIVETAQDAFILLNTQGVITEWNRQAEVIFGWSHQEAVGAVLAERILPSRDRHAGVQGLQQFLGALGDSSPSSMGRTIEMRLLRKSGQEFPCELSISPIPDGSGFAFSLFLRDITARKEAEELLRRSRDETELLLASLPALVVGVDIRGHIVRWNRAAEQVFGILSQEVVGKRFFDAPIRWDWNALRQASIDCFVHHEAVHLSNIPFQKKNGKQGFLELILTSTTNQNDQADLNFVLLGLDTTEQRVLESQLRQAQKMESIGQLAAGIAHEINTPTQFIGDNLRFLKESFSDLDAVFRELEKVFEVAASRELNSSDLFATGEALEMADMGYLRAEIPKAITQSLDGTDRVARIVRAMKEFSHPTVDERKPMDLNQAIESTVTVARNEWKYVADLDLDFDTSLPPVPCFPGEMNQVILNLIVNAAHAIAETPVVKAGGRGKITVRTRQLRDQVEIQIQDSGSGIPEAIRDRIFDPFFTTKEVGKGTGQGLFIAHRVVVDKHGGQILFDTHLGVGTTFKILLPLQLIHKPTTPEKSI